MYPTIRFAAEELQHCYTSADKVDQCLTLGTESWNALHAFAGPCGAPSALVTLIDPGKDTVELRHACVCVICLALLSQWRCNVAIQQASVRNCTGNVFDRVDLAFF